MVTSFVLQQPKFPKRLGRTVTAKVVVKQTNLPEWSCKVQIKEYL